MMNAKLTSNPPQVHAIDIVSEGLQTHLSTIAVDFLLWCVAVLTLITPIPLAASGGFAVLVLLPRVIASWTFHASILHIIFATPRRGRRRFVQELSMIIT
jgi:hypothetical protein